MLGAVSGVLATLESKPIWDTATRDTLGNTVPKTALTRSKAERTDVAISQLGNTAAFVGGGLSVDWMLRSAFKKFQQAGAKPVEKNWAVLSRSLGIYSAMMSSMWAMPFIRNYITTKRTGMVNYADVIKSGGAPKRPKTPEQEAAVAASLKDSKNKALTILGGGAAGILLPLAFGRFAGAKKWAANGLGKLFEKEIPLIGGKFQDRFLLEGGKFEKLGGIPSMMFWGIPAYIGWYHASRDPYEKKEVFVRCANFIACFSLPPFLAKKAFAGKFKQFAALGDKINFTSIEKALTDKKLTQETAKRAKKLLVWQNVLGMGSSIFLLGVTPQVLNIFLTNRRLAQEAAQKEKLSESKLVAPAPTMTSPTLSGFSTGSVLTSSPFVAQARQLPSVWLAAGLDSFPTLR
jgi:hypothetical protein